MTATHLCFVDTETTGLDPAVAELIEVAVLTTDLKAEKVLDRYTVRVAPLRPENISKEAAAVNGYKPETWLPVVPHIEVCEKLKEISTLNGVSGLLGWVRGQV
jgi:DNA polymerase III epsilon subunit-like protein